MPDQEVAYLQHKAVVWFRVGTDRYAQPMVAQPVQLDVRWNEKLHEVLDAHGNVIQADVEVVLDRPVPVGSMMWNGTLDILPADTLTPPSDVRQVIGYNATSDLKGRAIYRTASLMRWKDALPQVQPAT